MELSEPEFVLLLPILLSLAIRQPLPKSNFTFLLQQKNALGSSMAIRGCLFKMKLFKKPRVLGQKSYASVTALAG